MVRSLSNLRSSDAGFEAGHVAIFSIDTHVRGYDDRQAWVFRNRLLNAAKRLPGVEGAAIAGRALMRGIGWGNSVVMPGERGDGILNTSANSVTPDYFDVMHIRRMAGRGFTEADIPQTGKLTKAIVNEAFALKFLDGRNPIGAQFGTGHGIVPPGFEIIGVVGDTKYRSLREIPPPIFYTYDFRAHEVSGFICSECARPRRPLRDVPAGSRTGEVDRSSGSYLPGCHSIRGGSTVRSGRSGCWLGSVPVWAGSRSCCR